MPGTICSCLASAGFDYTPPAFVDPYAIKNGHRRTYIKRSSRSTTPVCSHGFFVASSYDFLKASVQETDINANALSGSRRDDFSARGEGGKNSITGLQDTMFPLEATAF